MLVCLQCSLAPLSSPKTAHLVISMLGSQMFPPESSSQFPTQTTHCDQKKNIYTEQQTVLHFRKPCAPVSMNCMIKLEFFFREWRNFDLPGSGNKKSSRSDLTRLETGWKVKPDLVTIQIRVQLGTATFTHLASGCRNV